MKYILVLFIIVALFTTCSQPQEVTIFTIKGKVMNGTTGAVLANERFYAYAGTRSKPSMGGSFADIGNFFTDKEGKFIFKYTQTKVNYDYATISLMSDSANLDNIAVNKNIDTVFYLSSIGTVNVIFNISKPLSPTDTLYLGISSRNSFKIDTILNGVPGLYKSMRVPKPEIVFFWGIGAKDFNFNKAKNWFNPKPHYYGYQVRGDPYVDIATINY